MSNHYVGFDTHEASILVAILSADGKPVMESVVERTATHGASARTVEV